MAGKNQPHEPAPSPAVGNAVGNGSPPRGYYDRKLTGWCTEAGCPRRRHGDSQLCQQHLERRRAARAASARRTRQARRDAGICATPGCGARCTTWYCPACAIRYDRVPSPAVGNAVGNGDRQPGGIWRDDANGWARYRGKGRRGAPPAGANDATVIKHLRDEVDRIEEALAYARSREVAEQGRITQRAAIGAVRARVGLLGRYCEDFDDELAKGR